MVLRLRQQLLTLAVLAVVRRCIAVNGQPLSLTELFTVNLDDNKWGGCADMGHGRLSTVITEAHRLAMRGVEVMNDYDNPQKPAAKRLVDAFFKPHEPGGEDFRGEIKTKYEAVLHWLENGGPVSGGEIDEKPRLFCNSQFMQEQTMDSPMRVDNSGEEQRDEDGVVIEVMDDETLLQMRDDQADKNGISEQDIEVLVPFWSWVHEEYFFDAALENQDDEFSKGYCDQASTHEDAQGDTISADFLGATHFSPEPWMLICHAGWSPGDGPWAFTELGSHEPEVKRLEDLIEHVGPLDTLRDQLTSSATLFHELFHLVLGDEKGQSMPPQDDDHDGDSDSDDGGGGGGGGGGGQQRPRPRPYYKWEEGEKEVYGLDCMDLRPADAASNPESYTYVAFAYDATQSIPAVDGFLVEFWTGAPTRWDRSTLPP